VKKLPIQFKPRGAQQVAKLAAGGICVILTLGYAKLSILRMEGVYSFFARWRRAGGNECAASIIDIIHLQFHLITKRIIRIFHGKKSLARPSALEIYGSLQRVASA
jgi:hypothetical protein